MTVVGKRVQFGVWDESFYVDYEPGSGPVLTGLGAGMRPCAGAIFVPVVSTGAHVPEAGISATLAMALGVSVTVAAIGLDQRPHPVHVPDASRPRLCRLAKRGAQARRQPVAEISPIVGSLAVVNARVSRDQHDLARIDTAIAPRDEVSNVLLCVAGGWTVWSIFARG